MSPNATSLSDPIIESHPIDNKNSIMMASTWKHHPDVVVDKVLKRAEVSKIARKLQNRLALAQFKTKHGWEDLTFDSLEPKVEQELRRKRLVDNDGLSDSSSSGASDHLSYPNRTLMSSPLKASLFSDALGSTSSCGSGRRKRSYLTSFNDAALSSPSKRFRMSPTAHKSFHAVAAAGASGSGSSWKPSPDINHHHHHHHQFIQSSPIKPKRQLHFTTSDGPDVSLFQAGRLAQPLLPTTNFTVPSDEDDDLLPTHSFAAPQLRSSPPQTPIMRSRTLASSNRNSQDPSAPADNTVKSGEEGADLLLYLAASPSPAVTKSITNTVTTSRTLMETPSTPPSKDNLALPSSMMMTPGGTGLFSATPGGGNGNQGFDFSDFIKFTPSPAQRPWKTPGTIGINRTPLSVARRRLTYEPPL